MKKMFTALFAWILIMHTHITSAQDVVKDIHSREQLWLGAFNQTRLSSRWGLWLDVHYRRTENFVERPFQFVIRPAVTYYIKDNLRVNVGYAVIQHHTSNHAAPVRIEHRPWQQLWLSQKYVGLTSLQWIRLEQRLNEKFVDGVKLAGHAYNFRVRYNLALLIPLTEKQIAAKVPFAAIMNEVFLNFGDRIIYNTFDQNRLFAGFGYQFTDHLNVQFGYMNVFQQEASGNSYLSTHAVRLFLFHSLDLRHGTE